MVCVEEFVARGECFSGWEGEKQWFCLGLEREKKVGEKMNF